ncbi:MAG: hypothetical protein RIQ81_1975 [Pseudomonadota bacterium]|jgi:hypothetical protein
MKRLALASIASVCVSTLLAGCGKDDETKANPFADLDGTWTMACAPDEGEDGSWSKQTAVHSGGTGNFTLQLYSDADCTTETTSLTMTATYTGGNAVATPAGAKEVDVTVSKVTITAKTDDAVTLWNNFCGGGFTKDTAKELTATTCADDASFKSTFDAQYTLYKIDGTKLYEGKCGDSGSATDCTTSAKRATELDTVFWTKS